VVALTCHPCAVKAAASFALLLHVHRNADVGSPRVTGSTRASNAASDLVAATRWEADPCPRAPDSLI
jgi:hypothetical protein